MRPIRAMTASVSFRKIPAECAERTYSSALQRAAGPTHTWPGQRGSIHVKKRGLQCPPIFPLNLSLGSKSISTFRSTWDGNMRPRKRLRCSPGRKSNTKLVPLLQSLLNSRHPLRYMLRVSELPCLALAWMAAPHGYCIPLVLETEDPP